MNFELVFRSIMLGVGLAMDAFSVSIADGLAEPNMSRRRMLGIAGTFAGFQFAMPVIGWILVRTAVEAFGWLEKFIPWIALALLLYIGGKMLKEGIGESRAGNADAAAASPGRSAESFRSEADAATGNEDPVHPVESFCSAAGAAKDNTDSVRPADSFLSEADTTKDSADTEHAAGSVNSAAGAAKVSAAANCTEDSVYSAADVAKVSAAANCTEDSVYSAADAAKDAADTERSANGAGLIAIQGIATSIDALSVGFTIERYTAPVAIISSLIIGVVTLGICMAGLASGKRAGTKMSGKASILGGVILIFIGIEIWAKGLFF